MVPTHLFSKLLTAGRSDSFAEVEKLPGAGDHNSVLRLADTQINALINYFHNLSELDRKCLIKAIAVYENTVGGLGSVTTLYKLLPLITDPDNSVLDWILSNTHSYWYYSNGAKSVEELNAARQQRANRRVESLRREAAREAEAKQRKAEKATGNLFNVIRRGDIKAVQALLASGADTTSYTPDGSTLYEYALTSGRTEIAALLRREEDE